jgi:hypothetical protein
VRRTGAFVLVGVVVVTLLLAACGDDHSRSATTETTADATGTDATSLTDQIEARFGALHRSAIEGLPNLVPLFYHHPDGWAVEDVSVDSGATWCRHAWYQWEVVEATSLDEFTVEYTPTYENPDCAPLGRPLVFDVARTGTDEAGRTTFGGEYTGIGWQVERTVCEGTIDDYADVCGVSSGLGMPTAEPPDGAS